MARRQQHGSRLTPLAAHNHRALLCAVRPGYPTARYPRHTIGVGTLALDLRRQNQRDLEAIDQANAEDLVGKAPNGVIVNGSDEHAAFLKNWFETSNPSWEFVYAMANDVPQPDGEIHHWVTSSYKVTDIIDGTEVVARESFDVRIENNKIKEIIVASRQVLAED